MNDLINALTSSNQASAFAANEMVFVIVLSFVLALLVGWVYKITHRGTSYTQSYVHTLVLMGMVVSIIMLIIGSNIARAFTLVGALSIIRFRNAVKETRDVGFIFLAMAIGMAVGTRFYVLAIVAAVVICFLVWGMVKFNFFAKEIKEQILKIQLPSDIPYETHFNSTFAKYLVRADLIAMETVQAGTLLELIYSIELKNAGNAQPLLSELQQRNDNNKVSLVTAQHEVDF